MQIAWKLEEDVAVRVLAANQRPDFRTFSDFRRQHLPALADLFVQVLQLCQRAGLVKLGHIALDGTKVKANASKHKAMSYGRMVTEEAQRNFTDPESRIMPASAAKGSVVQGYHCQAAIDATAQIILATDVTDEANDKQQAPPMLTQAVANTDQVPRIASMDAGYFSEANVTVLRALGCTSLIPPDRQLHSQAVLAAPLGRPSGGLPVADRMRRTLRMTRGRRLYARRKAIVEPVFGQIKQGQGYRQFLLRGMR